MQNTKTGISAVKEFKNLVHLSLGNLVTDDELTELADFNKLTSTSLSLGNQITDKGVKQLTTLKNLKKLTNLDLSWTKTTDAGVRELKYFENLTHLHLGSEKVTDACIKDINELKHLRHLYLHDCKITDAGLKELKNVTNVNIYRTEIERDNLEEVPPVMDPNFWTITEVIKRSWPG